MSTPDAKPKRTRRSKRSSAAQTNVTRFLQAMGIHANDAELFRIALTHRSAAGDRWRDEVDGPATTSNERLEFYGDAILGAVVAEYLYHRFADATEGTLT